MSKNQFVTAVQNAELNRMSFTENGAITNATTGAKLLDFFGLAASVRANPATGVNAFRLAFAESPKLAAQSLLWLRDVREGAGERNAFRLILKDMESNAAFVPYMQKILPYVPEIGRYDDLLAVQNTENRELALGILKSAIWNNNGLAAKWLPRKGKEAVEIRQYFGLSPKQYRKRLVELTKVVEQQMCAQNWTGINYSHVPSIAAARYQRAFNRHDPNGYSKYRAELMKPADQRNSDVKINAAAIFPYDVIRSMRNGDAAVAEAQWDALPNWMEGKVGNILPVIDVSGSMTSAVNGQGYYAGNVLTNMDVAISLGLYVATKNQGAFKNLALTFTGSPKWINLAGSLKNKEEQIRTASWAMNTDLQAAFRLILKTARDGNVAASDMPEYILIVSDMEFDCCGSMTNMQSIRQQYQAAGYICPKIIFWNMASRSSDNKPVRMNDVNTALVSGFSPSLLKSILSGGLEQYTPWNVMMETIDVDRYRIFEG